MSKLIEYETDSCYLVSSDNIELAAAIRFSYYGTEWAKQCFQDMLATTVFHISMNSAASNLENCLANDVTIYGKTAVATQTENVVAVYLKL